jgi:nitrogen regulatory protein PII
VYKGSEQSAGLVPKRMLIVYVPDRQVDEIVHCICDAARTGKHGDGKISVSDLTALVRIRTGEKGDPAL